MVSNSSGWICLCFFGISLSSYFVSFFQLGLRCSDAFLSRLRLVAQVSYVARDFYDLRTLVTLLQPVSQPVRLPVGNHCFLLASEVSLHRCMKSRSFRLQSLGIITQISEAFTAKVSERVRYRRRCSVFFF